MDEIHQPTDHKSDPVMDKPAAYQVLGNLGEGEGGVSIANRLGERLISKEEIEQGLTRLATDFERAKTGEYDEHSWAKPVEWTDAPGCVDGRQALENPILGPKTPGGSTTGIVMELIANPAKFSSFEEAAETTYSKLQETGFKIGGHDADHHGENGCGCGAEDAMLRSLELAVSQKDLVKGTVATLLGEGYQDELATEVLDNIAQLLDRHSDKEDTFAIASGQEQRDTQAAHGKVETLTGSHNEAYVVVNTVQGTTVDKDQINPDTNQNFQVFTLDWWYVQKMAQALSDTDPDQDSSRNEHTAAIWTVGVLLALTDGSQEIVVVS